MLGGSERPIRKLCAQAGKEVAADGAKIRVSVNVGELGKCINGQ